MEVDEGGGKSDEGKVFESGDDGGFVNAIDGGCGKGRAFSEDSGGFESGICDGGVMGFGDLVPKYTSVSDGEDVEALGSMGRLSAGTTESETTEFVACSFS